MTMTRKETFRNQCIRLNAAIAKDIITFELPGSLRQKAIEKMFPARPIASKRRAYCSHCGHEVHNLSLKECPLCHEKWGKPLRVERPSRHHEHEYLCVMTVMEGLQVMRFWYVGFYFVPGARTNYFVAEVQRQFINEEGERKVFSLAKPGMSFYSAYDTWMWSSEITIKNLHTFYGGYYGYSTPRYDLPCVMTVVKNTIPLLHRNGLRKSMHGVMYPVKLTLGLLDGEQVEKLWKQKQYALAGYAAYHILEDETMASIRICNRNHYYVSNVNLWIDHLVTLQNLGLDTHNAHYVCPKNLKKVHNEMVEHYNRRLQKEREAARTKEYALKLARLDKEKKAYIKRWGAMLNLVFKSRNLTIRPLQTVDEFAAEGVAMHHCVFSNEYYKKPTNMILSAKDSKGKRLATIEYDTKVHTILQCYAACNKVPKRDAEIRRLITAHKKDFKRLLKAA